MARRRRMVGDDGCGQRPPRSPHHATESLACAKRLCDWTMNDHYAFTIAGGPYGPLGGTHVFPRSSGLGVLLAGFVQPPGCTFRNVSGDPGGYSRGDGEIARRDFSPAELERL